MRCRHCGHPADAHTFRGCADCLCTTYAETDEDARLAAILEERRRQYLSEMLFLIGRLKVKPDDLLERILETDPWHFMRLLNNHQRGWWGHISAEQRAANEAAVRDGGTIVGCHPYGSGMCLWLITDTTRQETAVVLAPIAEGRPQ